MLGHSGGVIRALRVDLEAVGQRALARAVAAPLDVRQKSGVSLG
jgi:hypothetical protein